MLRATFLTRYAFYVSTLTPVRFPATPRPKVRSYFRDSPVTHVFRSTVGIYESSRARPRRILGASVKGEGEPEMARYERQSPGILKQKMPRCIRCVTLYKPIQNDGEIRTYFWPTVYSLISSKIHRQRFYRWYVRASTCISTYMYDASIDGIGRVGLRVHRPIRVFDFYYIYLLLVTLTKRIGLL